MLLGTVLGATVGGAMGWHAAEWSSNFRLLTLPGVDVLGLSGSVCSAAPQRTAISPMSRSAAPAGIID